MRKITTTFILLLRRVIFIRAFHSNFLDESDVIKKTWNLYIDTDNMKSFVLEVHRVNNLTGMEDKNTNLKHEFDID